MKFLSIPALLGISFILLSCSPETSSYVCRPCNQSCDALTFGQPGTCPHCGMPLMESAKLERMQTLALNEVHLENGAGFFFMAGGQGHATDTIKVFYHMPENFTPESKILWVFIPFRI